MAEGHSVCWGQSDRKRGRALLTLNVTLYRYFGPLTALSVVLFALSLVLAARDITRACTRASAQKQPDRAGRTTAREATAAGSRERRSAGHPRQPV
jgi:hypothetical protein